MLPAEVLGHLGVLVVDVALNEGHLVRARRNVLIVVVERLVRDPLRDLTLVGVVSVARLGVEVIQPMMEGRHRDRAIRLDREPSFRPPVPAALVREREVQVAIGRVVEVNRERRPALMPAVVVLVVLRIHRNRNENHDRENCDPKNEQPHYTPFVRNAHIRYEEKII